MTERTYGRTKSGKVVAEGDVDALSAEAEAGYDVDALQARRGRRGRPPLGSAASSVESVRLDPELRSQVAARAGEEGVSVSELIRKALRHYLDAKRH